MDNIINSKRKERGLTQKQLAKLLHLSQPQISKLCRGKVKQLSFKTARKIQDFCNISLEDVFEQFKSDLGSQ